MPICAQYYCELNEGTLDGGAGLERRRAGEGRRSCYGQIRKRAKLRYDLNQRVPELKGVIANTPGCRGGPKELGGVLAAGTDAGVEEDNDDKSS